MADVLYSGEEGIHSYGCGWKQWRGSDKAYGSAKAGTVEAISSPYPLKWGKDPGQMRWLQNSGYAGRQGVWACRM